MIAISVAAAICGADDWVSVAAFGRAREEWLRQFQNLSNCIPSYYTFGRVFSLLAPQAFEDCLRAWVDSVRQAVTDEIVASDGKSVCRSHNRRAGLGAPHMVSDWATANRMVLGQVAT